MMVALKRIIALTVALGMLAACGCSRSPRVHFYTLTAPPGPVAAPSAPSLPSIAVGAVSLPEFVDRPQLVISDAGNGVEILESHHWAESLKSALPRVLADNLSARLGADRVAAYPQQAGTFADYTVIVDFQHFESTADSVFIDALWTVRTNGKQTLSGRSRVREPRKEGAGTVAAAYSRALEKVSGEIAVVLAKEVRP